MMNKKKNDLSQFKKHYNSKEQLLPHKKNLEKRSPVGLYMTSDQKFKWNRFKQFMKQYNAYTVNEVVDEALNDIYEKYKFEN